MSFSLRSVFTVFCSIFPILLGVNAGWVLTWEDDFDGTEVNTTNWNIYNDTSEGSNQIELYTADNVWVSNSNLVLRTHLANISYNGVKYNVTSGRVDSSMKRNVTVNSRVEVRAMLQNEQAIGIHTAAWLLGYECWPSTGEIDIFEFEIENPDWIRSTANYHYGPNCSHDINRAGSAVYPSAPVGTNPVNFTNAYHIFAVEWNTTSLVLFVNNTVIFTYYRGMNKWPDIVIPNWDMFLILSQAYMAWRRENVPLDIWPVYQYIDYVRVYTWENNTDILRKDTVTPSV